MWNRQIATCGLLWLCWTNSEFLFQQMLFSKIVPNCKKLGLLDRNDQWLRRRFEEMSVIQFEDWETTDNDFENFALGEEVV